MHDAPSHSSDSATWAARWRPTWSTAGHTVHRLRPRAGRARARARSTASTSSRIAAERGRRRRRRHHHAAQRHARARRLPTADCSPAAHARARCSSTARRSTSPMRRRRPRARRRGRAPRRRRPGLRRRRRRRGRHARPSWSAAPTRTSPTAQPLLEVMGGRVVHCGGAGRRPGRQDLQQHDPRHLDDRGQRGVRARREARLSNQALFDVASNASGQCWALTTNCPVPGPVPTSPANRDYQPGFAGALMAKDLGLAPNALRSDRVDAELGPLGRARSTGDSPTGGGAGSDFSGIINDDPRPLADAERSSDDRLRDRSCVEQPRPRRPRSRSTGPRRSTR